MTYHAESTVIGIRKYWPDVQALTGSTIGATTITVLSGLTADKYRGGKMVVLDGNQAGEVYSIVDNTTTSIQVNRGELNETGNAIVNSTDRVALYPYKGISTETPDWILVDSFDAPTPEIEWEELHAHRTGGLPYRYDSYQKKNSMDSTLEITLQDGTFLPYLFGQVVDTGTTGGTGSSTTAADIFPGENVFDLADGTGFATDDYIRVGPAASGEIRKITNVSTNTITVDKSLRRFHASGVTAIEMDNTAVYTHTFTPYYDEIYRQLPFVITAVYNGNTQADNLTMNYFCQAKGFTFRNDGDKLKLSIPIIGYGFTYANGSAAPTVTADTTAPLIYANSSVSINGVEDGKVTTVESTMDYGAEARYFHNDEGDYYPSEIVFKRSTQSTNLGVRVESHKFLDLLTGGSKFDAYAQYTFATATHSLKIEWINNRPKSVPHNLPAGGPIETTLALMPQYVKVTLVDDEPYY